MNKVNASARTPPLNSLRTLVAVFRHGGVSRAAEKLHLTQGAVSHQIHTVQNALGMPLLEKRGRKLVPTREAMAYVARIEAAFNDIDVATQVLLESYHTARLHVSTTPSFAAHWLLPRLGDFVASNPSFDIRVDSSSQLVDIGHGDADIAIRFGAGDYPGLFSELLMRDRIFPVCSPAYAQQHQLAQPSDLDGLTLLRSDGEPWSWWFPVAGVEADEPTHGLVFSDSSLMLQAAIDGQGVGLVRQSVGREALAAGTLVRPFAASAETPYSYYFVCRKDRIDSPSIARFREWLRARISDQ
jgi:LysR family transcriptional regulator, glycine cleavage system transcriptional activator